MKPKSRPIVHFELALILWMLSAPCGCALIESKTSDVISVDARGGRQKAMKLNASGMALVSNGRHVLAFEKFKKAVQTDPTYGPAHSNLGLVYFNRGNLYEAALAFDAASEFMPENPMVLYNMGMVMEAAGKFTESIDYYGQAHDLAPTSAMILGNLVRARVRTGDDIMSVREQLQQLAVIETRKDWIDWIDRLLALDMNPWLDRGPANPDLSDLNDSDEPEKAPGHSKALPSAPVATGFDLAPGEVLLHSEQLPPGTVSVEELRLPPAEPMTSRRSHDAE